ncbi:MAG TPA: TolC family protein [Candidatus Krumholzibacteria bacterium]|nr:TolC family protein [Candidatus Krumholzibacteria bacterium]
MSQTMLSTASRWTIPLFTVVLLAGAHAGPSRGQDPDGVPDVPPLARAVLDSAVSAELANLPGAPLTLDEARALARTGATRVRLARAAVDAARGSVRRERGAYDPELYGEGSHRDREEPAASFFSGADVVQTTETRGEAGLRWRAPLGSRFSASLGAVRLETNNAFSLLQPQYDTFGELRLTQPLLDGFGAGERGDLTAAERRLEAAEARLADARLGTESAVEVAYWALYAAGRDFSVQRLITQRAEALLEQARTRQRAGLVGPADAASARVFLAEQRQALLDREEDLGRASDALADLIGQRPVPEDLYRPVDEPPADFPAPPATELIAAATAENLQLKALADEVAAVEARADRASRNALPSLDVFGVLGGTGLSGTPQDVQFGDETFTTEFSGNVGDGLSQVLGYDYPTWEVGFTFAAPIGGRADGGEADRLVAEVVRAEQQLEAARRQLESDVRDTRRALANGRERLAAARFGVEAASEQVRIGVLQYESGQTSAFELVRLSGDLAAAQQRYSRALVRTARAAAVLRQLTGGAYPEEETGP